MGLNEILATQVGGNHYKMMKQQPIEFIVKSGMSFIQGNMLKYICRYKNKNGLEDLKKVVQYADFAIAFNDNTKSNIAMAYGFCMVNEIQGRVKNVIISLSICDYANVKRLCNDIAKSEYGEQIF